MSISMTCLIPESKCIVFVTFKVEVEFNVMRVHHVRAMRDTNLLAVTDVVNFGAVVEHKPMRGGQASRDLSHA